MSGKIRLDFELTDSFGGEANYSWVKRESLELLENVSNRYIVRLAKNFAGYTGLKCKVENHGESWTIKPYKLCEILFINISEV